MSGPVPADDIPDSVMPAGAGAVPADDVPDSPEPGFMGQLAGSAIRQVGKGAINAYSFFADPMAASANLAKAAVGGKPDIEMPSSFWTRQLDKLVPPPKTEGGKIAEDIGGAVIGGATSAERKVVNAVTGRGVRGAEEAFEQPNRITTKAAEQAHAAGYDLSPAYIGGQIRRDVQTVAGGPKVHAEISESNEVITDRLAKLALGVSPKEDLTPDLFTKLKNKAYEAYSAVRELGTLPEDPDFDNAVKNAGKPFFDKTPGVGSSPRYAKVAEEKARYMNTHELDANYAVNEIAGLRDDARLNLLSRAPEDRALGYTQRQIADALEQRLEKFATTATNSSRYGAQNTEVVAQFREARRQLAIIHVVEDSIGAGGHVRASDMARLADAGIPLSPPLQTIATAYKNFPKDLQQITQKGQQGDFSAIDYLLGGSGIVSGHPGVAVLSAARPVSRWALRRDSAQKAMVNKLSQKPGPVKKAATAAYDATKKAVAPAARSAVRGGAQAAPGVLGGMSMTSPDLGESQP